MSSCLVTVILFGELCPVFFLFFFMVTHIGLVDVENS